jgi:Prophage protein (DUF1660)
MKLFCWLFGHRFVPAAPDPIGNEHTAWRTTVFCMRCAETKRIEL